MVAAHMCGNCTERERMRTRGSWHRLPGPPRFPLCYFTDPAVRPETTWRSMKAKSTTTGTMATTEAANR
ncbi:hypothetical protein GCM10009801_43350 [Streptomyces albiaxialis]|uniref:Uncharacterized protein n=1 Tax=Streptomyces albiaxialis TaxID=329523 RepID=A0ABP5HRB2_9ACTN